MPQIHGLYFVVYITDLCSSTVFQNDCYIVPKWCPNVIHGLKLSSTFNGNAGHTRSFPKKTYQNFSISSSLMMEQTTIANNHGAPNAIHDIIARLQYQYEYLSGQDDGIASLICTIQSRSQTEKSVLLREIIGASRAQLKTCIV